MIWFYTILGLGIAVLLVFVFQTLLGLRIVRFKGPMHWRVHRRLA